jgi:hypothetical protein
MRTSRRLWLALCALLLVAGVVALAWRAGPELLMFGGIVAVAAWGFGRHTRVKSREDANEAAEVQAAAVEAAAVDEAPAAKQEHIA